MLSVSRKVRVAWLYTLSTTLIVGSCPVCRREVGLGREEDGGGDGREETMGRRSRGVYSGRGKEKRNV